MATNQLVVARVRSTLCYFQIVSKVAQLTWIDGDGPVLRSNAQLKFATGKKDQQCEIFPANRGELEVLFNEPQRAHIAPGQSAVFYLGAQCLGGGIIV
ncbi:MAG: aminomethyltransferase beta-barrel domain-containing protein [Pseudomonadales bacterium]